MSDLGKKLTNMKLEYEWLKNVHSKVLQQSLLNLNTAFNNFFRGIKQHKKIGFPKFKSKKDNKYSCRFPVDAIMGIKGNRINIIQKLNDIHFKCSIKDEKYLNKNQKDIKSGTLSKTKSGKYYFTVLIDRDNDERNNIINESIGLDLGIKDFIITSEGETFNNIKIKRNNSKKISRLHRRLTKKVKGSKNKEKCRIKLAKYYEKLSNIKDYYLHSVSNKIINENQIVCIEDLNVKGMMSNSKLSKSIQELSLGRFVDILEYKGLWYGREIVKVGRFYASSKTCSCCGHKNEGLKLSDRKWVCDNCGTEHDRDYNASLNIKNEGLRIYKEKIGLSSPELTPLESSY
jgi:putative transposase